jgi:2-polyprenyl-3-methyl-5-hydroxy-6-metoxy-1,4-benzoquinol methylase
MNINGLEINSPVYWEIRHHRESWPRESGWVLPTIVKSIPQDARVLEIGCGQGAFAASLKKSRPDVTMKAIDCSPTAIEKARNHYVSTGIKFQVADVFNLTSDLKDEEYDYIITIQNFEHWHPSIQKEALHQMWKRLKLGGKLFFTGVGEAWDLTQMNYSPMMWKGGEIQAPNDYHYNKWSEQDFYDLCQTQKAKSVKFWRLRGKDRIVAEVEKDG